MIYTYESHFRQFVTDIDRGSCLQIDAEMFAYWLDVLPPLAMSAPVILADGTRRVATFLYAEGDERPTAFWEAEGGFYGQLCR